MRGSFKSLGLLWIVAVVVLAALVVALRHNSPCGHAPPLAGGAEKMKAVTFRCYGPPQVLRLEDTPRPVVGADSVLVRVHAAALNPHDLHLVQGTPYAIRAMLTGIGTPREVHLGSDFAGTVVAVGRDVKRFRTGDEVFGAATGALAEYVTVGEKGAVAMKPAALSFEEAAAVPVAGVTALQALRNLGHIHAGERVLINGASGGVGSFAVQLAKSFGAEVTAVCSTRNVERVRSLGADHVIDYSREDFTRSTARYGLILDDVGNRSLTDYLRILEPRGVVALVGAAKGDWIGPFAAPMEAAVLDPFLKEQLLSMHAHPNADDLTTLAGLIQAGKVKPLIDRSYRLTQASMALDYLEGGHAQGKVVINVD